MERGIAGVHDCYNEAGTEVHIVKDANRGDGNILRYILLLELPGLGERFYM